MARRELFGEYLAALKSSRRGRWTYQTKASRPKRLCDPRYQRSFRTYDGQFSSDRFCEACKTDRVIHIGWQARCDFTDACVARRAVEFCRVRAVFEAPNEGVLPAARANYEDPHSAAIV